MTGSDLGFIHHFVPASGDTAVTLLLLHGTGGNEEDLIPLGQELLPGAALLSPRGRVRENGMPRFFRRLAEGVFDQEDLKLRTNELAQFIAAASSEYGLHGKPMVAVGYSNGANIAASLLLTHPRVLAGAALLRPMIPFRPPTTPNLTDVPILLAAGRNDGIVPPQQTPALAEILKNAGAQVSIHWHAGGHELGRDDVTAARNWLTQWRK
jgi:predicted esterase